ncbi:minor capsid protein [Caldicoprobacter faecalis]|uniref:Phage putative head morphogenesis protein, SPP1 gp7 family n=1 Tax=Caldicoprobacter faecalis TaxID=937334 RepID=A0A1I5WTQ5_9FIRM|nr:minor capsid protein [Caldicoprobacter faecalis]SFQ22978.1 phage putative head morphogenesis protein, SPP1 gp7 family [Caldicoprobacter faecalis]
MSKRDLEKELLRIRQDADKLATKESAKLLKAYKRALERIKKQIADIYMEYDITGDLGLGKIHRFSVLSKLEKELLKLAQELGAEDILLTGDIVEKTFKETYYKTAYILDKGIETGISFAILKPEFVKAAINMPIEGKRFSDRIWDNKSKLVARVRDSVERALIDGTDIRKLAKEITNDFGSSIYESQRLISTEVARAHTMAQEEIYHNSGVVQKVMWNATLEDNTCEECQALDGQIFDLDGDRPEIPLHPNCRCVFIPVVDGWSPSRRRDQESGEIIEYKNYQQWLKDKNIDY